MIPKIIIGAQWGDEGKGKIVDVLSKKVDCVVRFNGGNNAGHTIVLKEKKYPLSLLPSGVLWKKELLISQGVVIDPKILLNEINFFVKLKNKPNLTIDPRCNIVMPYHKLLDEATEAQKGDKKVGSLKLGIGYCYEDRNNRQGIRMEDLIVPTSLEEKLSDAISKKKKRIEAVFGFTVKLSEKDVYEEYVAYGKKLKKYVQDVSKIVSESVGKKKILFEGAHGTFLDGNFGTYPYTTAVNTISGSVFAYVGFPPRTLDVIGIVKAYTTRVGGGPFPTEQINTVGQQLGDKGAEFGTVSKRRRRCGWLDLPQLRLSQRLNGFTSIALTKVDVLSGIEELYIAEYYKLGSKNIYEMPSSLRDVEKVKPVYKKVEGWNEDITKVKTYKQLPKNCRVYIEEIEKAIKVPIRYISVGPDRTSIITK